MYTKIQFDNSNEICPNKFLRHFALTMGKSTWEFNLVEINPKLYGRQSKLIPLIFFHY